MFVGDGVVDRQDLGLAGSEALVGRVQAVEGPGAVLEQGEAGRCLVVEAEAELGAVVHVGGDQFAEAELVFSARCAGSLGHRRIVGAGDGDGQAAGAGGAVLIGDGERHLDGLGGSCFQVLVFADAGIEGPLAVGIDAEAGRGSLVEGVGELGAIVGVGGGELATDLRVFLHGAAGGAGHRCIVGAVDGDGHGAAGAVGGLHGEGVGELVADIQLVVGAVGGVGPGAVGAEIEGAVQAGDVVLGLECGRAVDVGDIELAAEGQRGVGFIGAAAGLAGDHRRVVGAGDGDGDGLRVAQRAVVVLRLVGEGHVAGLALGEAVEVLAGVEAIAAVRVEAQAAVALADACGQLVAGDAAVHVAGGRNLAIENGVLFGGGGARLGNRRVVGAGDGDGDGLRVTQRTVVVLRLVGEGHVAGLALGEAVEVLAGVEAIAAVRVEAQAAVALADACGQLVAGDAAVHVAGGRNLAVEHGVLFGGGSARQGDRRVVGAGQGHGKRGGAGGAVLVGDGVGHLHHLGLALGQVLVGRVLAIEGPAAVRLQGEARRRVAVGSEGEGAAGVAVGGHQLAADHAVLGDAGLAILGDRRVVGALHVDGDDAGVGSAGRVGHGDGEAFARVLPQGQGVHRIGVDHIGVAAVGVDGEFTVGALGAAAPGQVGVVDVGGGQLTLDVGEAVVGGGVGDGAGIGASSHRSVVHRGDADVHYQGAGSATGVGDDHGETVGAVVVAVRVVLPGAVGIEHQQAIGRGLANAVADGVAIRIAGGEGAREQGVLGGGEVQHTVAAFAEFWREVGRQVALALVAGRAAVVQAGGGVADVRVDVPGGGIEHHEAVTATDAAIATCRRSGTGARRGRGEGLGRVEAGGDGLLQVLGARSVGRLRGCVVRLGLRQVGAAPLAVAAQVHQLALADVERHRSCGAGEQLFALVDAVTFDQDALDALGGYRNHLADDAFHDGDDAAHALLLVRLAWLPTGPHGGRRQGHSLVCKSKKVGVKNMAYSGWKLRICQCIDHSIAILNNWQIDVTLISGARVKKFSVKYITLFDASLQRIRRSFDAICGNRIAAAIPLIRMFSSCVCDSLL